MTEHERKVLSMVSIAAIYVPMNTEAVLIDYWDTDWSDESYSGSFFGSFFGTGEETGNAIMVRFADVDFSKDIFYRLTAMDPDAYPGTDS